MANATCSIDGCGNPSRSRGWCASHYDRWRRTGDVRADVPLVPRLRGTPEERFLASIEVHTGGCWIWTNVVGMYGYGQHSVDRRSVTAHRWAYEHYVGPIPENITLDHLCHTRDESCRGGPGCLHRRCVNPAHLEPVTMRENLSRSSNAPATLNTQKTHCPQGHAYAGDNLVIDEKGRRRCRDCGRWRAREYARRRRATSR